MIRWNNLFFPSPSSFLIELVVVIHDYVIIFLFSVILSVLIVLTARKILKKFRATFFEEHQLERIWTIIPFIMLIFILIPSLSSLYILDTCLFCGVSIRIIGHQWYWRYAYKDIKDVYFDSYILSSDQSNIRLLETDNRLIIPTYIPVRYIVRSSDVVHSWTVPSIGVKIDAIPGRINQFCFSTKRSGVYFGQCSEICGANHRFMPIVMESVPFNNFIQTV